MTMKPGAADLSEESVTGALKESGWGVKEFKAGSVEVMPVHLFELSGTKAEDHAALAKKLQAEIKGAQDVAIDTDGRVFVRGGELTEASLGALLKAARDGWSAKAFQTKQLPKTLATYV